MISLWEWVGCITGSLGAVIMAIYPRWGVAAWLLWAVSSVGWIAFGFAMKSHGLVIQQLIFLTINIIGLINWTCKARAVQINRAAGPPQDLQGVR